MTQELHVQYLPTEELIPYAQNARTHSASQIKQIAKSIQKFGFITPIIVDEQKMIVAGHARVMAANTLSLNIVPCIEIAHLTQAQKRAYILADNKLAENATWDESLLRIELDYLVDNNIDVDVDLTGFSIPEIDLILNLDKEINDEEPESSFEAPPDNPITQMGDLWLLGSHRVMCGDCRDSDVVDRLMDSKQAQLVITDPPYNVKVNGHVCGSGKVQHHEFAMASGEMSSEEFSNFLQTSLSQLARVSANGSLHFICMDWRHIPELIQSGKHVYDSMQNLCVWNKTNGGMGSLYRSQHELIFVYKKGDTPHINNVELGKHGRYRTNVWTYAGVNTFSKDRDKVLAMHPTVKPIKMFADAMLDVTRLSDIVLDGFLGSGTTLLAAEQTKRTCYGIEINPGYVDVALRRWIELTGIQPIHENTGKTYTELSLIEA